MRRHTLALAVGLAGCSQHAIPKDLSIESTYPAAPTTRSLPRELRVVTFNVHMQPASKVIEGIRNDRALRDADVFILEEVHRDESNSHPCSGACGLGNDLGFYSIYAPGHAANNGSDGVAIVSRVPFTSTQVLELPYFNVHFNSGRRVAIKATLNIDDKPVTLYAVHLDNRLDVRDRRKQMLPVLEHAERQPTPVIIAGDFNTGPFTWISHVIPILTTTQDDRFEELVRAHGFATPVAEAGPTHRYIAMKLDGIYTRGFDTVKFATADARNISDHLALWAEVKEH
jgi:endonuclease/exonuclease/phosphatase family metal-dependent hydrolase